MNAAVTHVLVGRSQVCGCDLGQPQGGSALYAPGCKGSRRTVGMWVGWAPSMNMRAGGWGTRLPFDRGEVIVDAVGTQGHELVDHVEASPANVGVFGLCVKSQYELDDGPGVCSC